MMPTSYYLGVDGGGSKTLAVIVDAQGQERGRGVAGSSNYTSVGFEQALQNIRVAVEQAAQTAGAALPFAKAWFGIAGIDRPEDLVLFTPHLRPLAEFFTLTNDCELILGALDKAVGIALIAGTGSIALGRDAQGIVARAGGWGYLIGDEGSGYDIGRQGVQAATRAADGRGPQTAVLAMLLQHWNLARPDDIIGKIYPATDKSRIAQLSTYVFQAMRQGDPVACSIVQGAAQELALVVKAVSEKLHLPSPLPLAFGGGLLLHETDFSDQVIHALRRHLSIAQVVHNEQPALSAARAVIDFTLTNN